jgi:hypothetical protein
MSQYYFAWVEPENTTFLAAYEREDEQVFSFKIDQSEGDFAALSIDIANPYVGLLGAGRKRWAWLAHDDGVTVTPLFFGRLVGVPDGLQDEVVRLTFLARPSNFETQKQALAGTLRVAPYYDPVWINADKRDDPDAVLEGYAAAWHVDRVTHVVSLSSIVSGAATVEIEGGFFYDSLGVAHGAPGARAIKVEAEVFWDQRALGSVDISQRLIEAFAAAGTATPRAISSFTGEGLMRDWPVEGKAIGGGWKVGHSVITRTDGFVIPQDYEQVLVANGRLRFPVWTMKPDMFVDYEVSRARSEKVSFSLEADIQEIVTQAGDEEVLSLTLASQDIGAGIDPPFFSDFGVKPIGDLRRRAYFTTDRGKQSLEVLISIARARLLHRARAVDVSVQVDFATGMALSCAKNASVEDNRLPGGAAAGKIKSYALVCDGDSGVEMASLTIGCMIGKGNSVAAAAGTGVYAADGYMADGYQLRSGRVVMPIAGEVTYDDFGATPIEDDGIDFFNLNGVTAVASVNVINGIGAQAAAMAGYYSSGVADMAHAVNALNAIYTEIDLDMTVLTGGPFRTEYAVDVSGLMVPRTIDLEAV